MLTTSDANHRGNTLWSVLGKTIIVVGVATLMFFLSTLSLSQPWRVYAASAVIAVDQPAASIRYVAVEGTDAGNDCSLSTNPCATVQRAVDVAVPDDEIRVAAGTYTGVQVRQGITQVVYITQPVTIRGGYTTTNWTTSDPGTYATILDAQGQGRVLVILGARVTLEGLRITGGDTQSFPDLSLGITGRVGGGLHINAPSSVVISGCQVYSNAATYFGGGLYAYSSAITMTQNRVFSNSLSPVHSIGGGVYAELGTSIVDNNSVFSNSAVYGGGVYLGFGSLGGRLSENQIYNNRAYQRGGGLLLISTQTPGVLISRNVFSQNVAGTDGGGMWLGTGISVVTGNLFISNTANNDFGGGVYVLAGADAVINNEFISNTANAGGGINLYDSSATLIGNRFQGNNAGVGGGINVEGESSGITATANVLLKNTASYGGGLSTYRVHGSFVFTGNTLVQNRASSNGGAIMGYDTDQFILERNVISGNFGSLYAGVSLGIVTDTQVTNNAFLNNAGYALVIDRGHATVAHNTVISNLGGISLLNYGVGLKLTLSNTIFARNTIALDAASGTTATLNGILWYGNGVNTNGAGYITVGQQITANPLLAADSYHLLTGSPAIDTGVFSGITDDIDGEPRPSGPAVDIGADEWQYPASASIRYVAVAGVDAGNDCTVSTMPCATVQHAVNVAVPNGDVIIINPGTYTESLTLNKSVNLVGLDRDTTVLQAKPGQRVLTVTGSLINNFVTISGLTFTGGNLSGSLCPACGGGILITGTAQPVLQNIAVVNNYADQGGGLYIRAGNQVTLTGSLISNNRGHYGGGVINDGHLVIGSSRIASNSATLFPGGILNLGTLSLSETTVAGNTAVTAGGGIYSYGATVIKRSTISGNSAPQGGGGLYNSVGGVVSIANSTISGNSSTKGAGLYNYAGPVDLNNVTIGYNVGTSIENFNGAILNFKNTILINCVGTLISQGYNLIQDPAGCTVSGDPTGNIIGLYPYLGPLQDNGGSTLTHALLPNSPAIDSGNSAVPGSGDHACEAIDQRGLLRPMDGRGTGNAVCDIGAYEFKLPLTVDLSVTQQIFPVVAYPNESVTYTITYRNVGVGVPATGVVISAEIPAGLTNLHVISSSAVLTSVPGMTYTWQVADLPSGAGGLITITATVMPGLAPQALTSTVSITASQSDSNPANNVTSAMLTIANRAPVASVGPDQNALTGETITLDGSASIDPDGHEPLTYEWQQIGGAPIVLSSNTVSRPLFTAPAVPSILRFSLSVTDSVGLRSTVTATAVVTVTDRPVTNLRAVNDSPTTVGHVTMFVATAEGSNLSYTWNFGDGEIAAGQVTTHIYVLSGTYTAVVTASNGSGSITATTPVTITNLAPFANAGPDQAVAINALMTLDGSASLDPDGHLPLSYEWQQISGSLVVLSSRVISRPVFTAPNAPSVLAFSLAVTDSQGLRSPVFDTVAITVNDLPISTVLAMSSSPTTLGHPTWFTATATGSNISYRWDFGDGTIMSGNPISHTYAAQGFYTALVIMTNGVNSLTTTLPVTITNLAPVAVAGSDQAVIVTAQVDLDGSHSYDQDGHLPLAYHWTQVGGPAVLLSSAVISRPIFTALATPSVLTFTLHVTDAYGLASAIATTVIRVTDQVITGLQAANSSPIKVNHSANLTATLAAGSNVTYHWNFGDGVISVPTNLLTATHVYTRYGSFTAIVTATNQSGLEVGETLVVVQPYSIYIPLLRKDS